MSTPDELVALARRLDEGAFAKKVQGLFLIVRGGESPKDPKQSTRRVLGERKTLVMEESPPPPSDSKPFAIVPVVRRGSSPFADMVSVGRVEGNDIVLPHPTVSKLHACFSEEDGIWTLTDQGSTNGTFVGGERLRPQEPRRLGGNEIVAFGQFYVALKSSGALWRFLALERRTA